jgi:septum formation protein
MKLVLGSASPRRKELLAAMGLEFRVLTADCDEYVDPDLGPEEIVLAICKQKAEAILPQLEPDETLICADTIVYLKGEVLGKPTSAQDAFSMLKKLAGQTHEVYTGVWIQGQKHQHQLVDCTQVRFQELQDEDLHYYIENFKPFDKAGSYGVQDWIGHVAVIELHGSYTNVMGLPTQRLYPFLKNND